MTRVQAILQTSIKALKSRIKEHEKNIRFVSQGLLLLPFFLLFANAKYYAVVNIEKELNVRKLSSKDFHDANLGRVLFYFGTSITKDDIGKLKVNDLQYTGKVAVGSNAQRLNVIFDTSVPDVLVLSSDNSQAKSLFSVFGSSRKGYNEEKSFTKGHARIPWDSDKDPTFQMYKEINDGISGHLIYDKIQIGNMTVGGAQWLLGVITIGNIYGSADGVVGIGRMSDTYFSRSRVVTTTSQIDSDTVKTAPSFVEILKRHGASKIGIDLSKTKKSKKIPEGKEVGQIIFGAEKENKRHRGKMVWLPQPEMNVQYWRITISEIKIVGKPEVGHKDPSVDTVDLKSTEALAILDPGTSVIAGPRQLIERINAKLFKGMELFKTGLSSGTVEFDCEYADSLPKVVFLISNKQYTLEPQNYVRKLGNACASGFMGVDKLESLVLGDTFFQKHYIVFDNLNNSIGIAESTAK